ncbi:MAG: hypothetical protein V1849_05075, partial [Chloroflexota bacterium]
MEYAIYVSKIKNLKYADENFTRLYYGAEFCQNLLPTPRELRRVLDFLQGRDFTLVTPYVTEDGLQKLDVLFRLLAEARPDSEVVFSDWGVLRLLREKYPTLIPVLGRLLNKMKRDSRLMTVLDKVPSQSQEYFRGSSLSVPLFRRFLREQGVKRVEFDNVLQGIDFNFDGISVSLYMPYAYITTTRACLVNACDQPEKRELVGIFPCKKECQEYTFYLESRVMPAPLIRQGNTIFLKNEALPA